MNLIKKIKAFFLGPEKKVESRVVRTSDRMVVSPPKNIIKEEKKKYPKTRNPRNYKLKQKKKRKFQKLSRNSNR